MSRAGPTVHGRVAGQRDSGPVIQFEPDPELAHLLFRTGRQTISWYLLSKPVVAAGTVAAMVLAVSLSSGCTRHRAVRLSTIRLPSPVQLPRRPYLPGSIPRDAGQHVEAHVPSPTAAVPPPTTTLGSTFSATVQCRAPVTLVVTGTGTGTNTLHVTGPATTRTASGREIVLFVAGPEGTYTLVDTDSGGHPGVFWASHGSVCYPRFSISADAPGGKSFEPWGASFTTTSARV